MVSDAVVQDHRLKPDGEIENTMSSVVARTTLPAPSKMSCRVTAARRLGYCHSIVPLVVPVAEAATPVRCGLAMNIGQLLVTVPTAQPGTASAATSSVTKHRIIIKRVW